MKRLILIFGLLSSNFAYSMNIPGLDFGLTTRRDWERQNDKYYSEIFSEEKKFLILLNKKFNGGKWYLQRNKKSCDYCDYSFGYDQKLKNKVWVQREENNYILSRPQIFEVERGKKYRVILLKN